MKVCCEYRVKWFLGLMAIAIVSFFGYSTEPDTLARRLEYQTLVYPQEKVYVATDKNVYMAGDTIRLRAFLVDALRLTQQQDGSKYVYVEVLNPFGKSVKKIKVKERDGMFAGIVALPQEMPEGTYTLAAYTLFMKNQGEDFLFRKPLPILSQLAKKYNLKTEFEGNSLKTILSENFGNKPARASEVSLWSKDGAIREDVSHRSDFNFSLNKKAMKEGVLKVKYDLYEKFVRVPEDTSSFVVTFHPEGGYMIPGVVNQIAFKALGSDGLSTEAKGEIVTSQGEKVCDIESGHKGMGSFEFVPQRGEIYSAKIGDKLFELPAANAEATSLSIEKDGNDSIIVKVKGKFDPGMVLLADNCGVVTFAGRMQKPKIKLSRKGLGSGLVELYLLNTQDDIISSRLILNRSGYIYTDSVVSLPKGDYAVTSRKVVGDSLHNLTIVSELMLQSDIKGYIEEPDYYFTDVDSIKDRNLDNLLLTQGWKRYDIQNALKGKFEEPKEPIEVGGAITGTVYSRWQGKPLAGATVNALSTGVNFGGIAETDSNGKFVITGTDWPDGTCFALQAFNKNGNKEHNLDVDEGVAINVTNLPETNSCERFDPKLLENGAVWLKEVDVVAPKTAEEQHDVLLRALGVRSITAEDIKDNNYTTYEEIIRKISGLNIINGNLVSVSARKLDGSRGLVEFWVDGHRWEPTFDHENPQNISGTFYEFTSNYPLHIVEKIQFYRPSGAMFLSNYASANAGAIAITTKNGSGMSWDHNLFIKRVAPLGYQNLAEAYRPHFVYDPIEKVPTVTSLWYPRINRLEEIKSLDDADIVVEGITELGLPYRGVIKAKDEKE